MSSGARQVIHTVFTRAVMLLVGALVSVVIARSLGPEGRGAYFVIITIATTAISLGHLSVEQAQARLWTRPESRSGLSANSVLLGMSVGVLSALGTAVVTTALGPQVMPVPSRGLLAVALLAIPCSMTVLYLNNILVLRARVEWINWSGLCAGVVHCVALVVLAGAGSLSPGWVVVMWVVSQTLPLSILIPVARPRLRSRDLCLARRELGMGLRYHTGLVSLFLLFRVDVLMLNAMMTNAAVGLYSLAMTLIELTRVTVDSIAQVALPRQMEGDHDSAAAFTARTARLTLLFATGSVGLMCAVAPIVVPAVYGAAFAGSIPPLLGLAPGLVVLGGTRTVAAFLLRLDRPVAMSAISVTALAVNVILNLILIPAYGIVGCAVASSIGYGVLGGLQVTWFLRATRLSLGRVLPGREEIRYLREVSVRSAGALPARMRLRRPRDLAGDDR